MTVDELDKELKTGKLNNIYLLYGEEEYLLENSLKKLKKNFGEIVSGINYIQIDSSNVDKLIDNIETPAFGYERKLIIIKYSLLFKKIIKSDEKSIKSSNKSQSDKIAKYIEENINLICNGTVLVFVEKEVNKTELFKVIEKTGITCNFEKLKPFQISKKIKEICNMYKVKISDSTVQEFIEMCGTNMQNLINEIRKLIEYVGEGGTITSKDIKDLSIKEFDTVIFELTDSLGQKNVKNALEILHELIYNKEPIQKILITLYGHFKRLYLVTLSVQYNYDIIETLNLKANQIFLVSKYKKQASYFKALELRKIMKELTELDYKVKQGLLDINIGLEAILCTYCG